MGEDVKAGDALTMTELQIAEAEAEIAKGALLIVAASRKLTGRGVKSTGGRSQIARRVAVVCSATIEKHLGDAWIAGGGADLGHVEGVIPLDKAAAILRLPDGEAALAAAIKGAKDRAKARKVAAKEAAAALKAAQAAEQARVAEAARVAKINQLPETKAQAKE